MWLICVVVGPSPLLAEVPECDSPPILAGFCYQWWWVLAEGHGCDSPPLLAGVRWRRWCVVACHSWLRVLIVVLPDSWLRGPLVAVVGGPLATPG